MFNVGDLVRCITNKREGITNNRWYTVMEVTIDHIKVTRDDGYWQWVHKRWFERTNVKDDQMEQTNVFMVYNNTNRGTPRVTHQSFEDAKNEAIRLATVTPNCEFLVLQATYSVKRIPQYTTEEKTFNICS